MSKAYDFPDDIAEIEDLAAFIQGEIGHIDIQLQEHKEQFRHGERDVEWMTRANLAKHHKTQEKRALMVHKRNVEFKLAATKKAEKLARITSANDENRQRFNGLKQWLSEKHPKVWEDAKRMLHEEFPN